MKDKGKKKEDEAYTTPRSIGGEDHDEHGNRSKFLNRQSENSELETNPHAALLESF